MVCNWSGAKLTARQTRRSLALRPMPAGEGRRGELRRGRGKARSVPAKYRNPKNADEVWSGRGRMPLWLGAAIKAGKDRDDFLIA